MAVTIYTRKYCSYCVRAKHLFDHIGVAYREVPVDRDPEAFEHMKATSGRRTVPQIWIGQTHVGGCDELMSLHSAGRLQGMLAEPSKLASKLQSPDR